MSHVKVEGGGRRHLSVALKKDAKFQNPHETVIRLETNTCLEVECIFTATKVKL